MNELKYAEIAATPTYTLAEKDGRLFNSLDAAATYVAAFGGVIAAVLDEFLDEYDEYHFYTREYIVL